MKPLKIGDFQGQTVNLPEGNIFISFVLSLINIRFYIMIVNTILGLIFIQMIWIRLFYVGENILFTLLMSCSCGKLCVKLCVKYHITYCIIVFILCCIDYFMIINVDSGYWIYGIYIHWNRSEADQGWTRLTFQLLGFNWAKPLFLQVTEGFLYVTAIPSIQSVPSLKESVKLLN